MKRYIFTLLLVLSLMFPVPGGAEEQRSPIDIYDMQGNLLISIGCTAMDVVGNMGLPEDIYDPYVIYDSDELSVPEIKEPEMNAQGKNVDIWRALLDAVPNEWDTLDVASAEMALEPFGIDVDDLASVLDVDTFSRDFIEGGYVNHGSIQSYLRIAEDYVRMYNEAVDRYKEELKTPYEEWIEEVGSSLTITEGMLRMMSKSGWSILFGGLHYNGIGVSLSNDRDALAEKMPEQTLQGYLKDRLLDTQYETIEARNKAISDTAEEYYAIYKAWNDQVLNETIVTGVHITKMGYQTGNGEYIGQPYDIGDAKWGVTNYYSGTLPLAYDYVKGLSEEDKAEIEGLVYCTIRVDKQNFISAIDVAKYVPNIKQESTPEPEEKENEEIVPTEEAFISDLLQGLTARDQIVTENPDVESYPPSKYQATYTAYVEAEKNFVDKYRDIEFTDETVKEAALLYLDGLDRQYKSITEYYGTKGESFNQYWSDGFYERCRALYVLSEKYDLKVRLSLRSVLADMIDAGKDVEVTIEYK